MPEPGGRGAEPDVLAEAALNAGRWVTGTVTQAEHGQRPAQPGRVAIHIGLRPQALPADLGEERRHAECRGGRCRRARQRPDHEIVEAVRGGHRPRLVVDRRIAGLLDAVERHQRLVHVAAVHVDEGVGAGHDLVMDPAREALGRAPGRVAREDAVQVAPVERVDVDRASGERGRTRHEHRHEAPPHGRGIELHRDTPVGRDRHVLRAVDAARHGDPRTRLATVGEHDRHLDRRDPQVDGDVPGHPRARRRAQRAQRQVRARACRNVSHLRPPPSSGAS